MRTVVTVVAMDHMVDVFNMILTVVTVVAIVTMDNMVHVFNMILTVVTVVASILFMCLI